MSYLAPIIVELGYKLGLPKSKGTILCISNKTCFFVANCISWFLNQFCTSISIFLPVGACLYRHLYLHTIVQP